MYLLKKSRDEEVQLKAEEKKELAKIIVQSKTVVLTRPDTSSLMVPEE